MTAPPRTRRGDVMVRFADQALVSVGNFAVAVLLARVLGPTQFGVYALVWAVVILSLGGHWALITSPMQSTLAATAPSDRGVLFASLLAHAALLSVLAGVICTFATLLSVGSRNSTPLLAGIASAVPLVVLQEFARRWLLATERPALALLSDSLRHGITLIGLLLLLGLGDASVLSCMVLIGMSSLAGLSLLSADWRQAAWSASDSLRQAKQHVRVGRWLLPSVLLQSMSAGAPLYALGLGAGVATAGGYRAALNLLSPVVSLTEALETFLPLRGSQALHRGGPAGLRAELHRWGWPFGTGCTLFVLAVWWCGPWLLDKVYGDAYRAHAAVLAPLGAAMLLQFGTYLFNVRLRALGRAHAIFTADVVATGVLLALLMFAPVPLTAATAALWVAASQSVKLSVLAFAALRATTAS